MLIVPFNDCETVTVIPDNAYIKQVCVFAFQKSHFSLPLTKIAHVGFSSLLL